jgi:hypothetical protein
MGYSKCKGIGCHSMGAFEKKHCFFQAKKSSGGLKISMDKCLQICFFYGT